jgi:hypothetical protein
MVVNKLLDRLQAKTGRRSLNRQPSLARMWRQGLMEKGFEKPFPESIEEFTGKEFSATEFIRSLILPAQSLVEELEAQARP